MNSDEDSDSTTADFVRTLASARLVLRLPHETDAKAIAALADNASLAEMTASIPHPYNLADAHAFIARAREQFASAPTYVLQVRQNNEVVGACGLRAGDDGAGWEIGYWIGETYWGRGYATEAAQTVIDLFFDRTANEQLFGACRVINRGSRRVLEKCGFQRYGQDMISSRALRGLVPVHRYRLERKIWRSLKGWAGAIPA